MSKALKALVAIQGELKAPKTESAGRYRYRNIEDINEAVKPLAAAHGCAVAYTDRFTEEGACVSTCRLIAEDGEITADGVAYVNRSPKNMSVEQASGAASSYARKYAACGLFAIDSSENDPDRTNAKQSDDAALKAAKKRLMAAIDKWAELNGMDAAGAKGGIQKRPGYAENADNPEWFIAIAEEFENA